MSRQLRSRQDQGRGSAPVVGVMLDRGDHGSANERHDVKWGPEARRKLDSLHSVCRYAVPQALAGCDRKLRPCASEQHYTLYGEAEVSDSG